MLAHAVEDHPRATPSELAAVLDVDIATFWVIAGEAMGAGVVVGHHRDDEPWTFTLPNTTVGHADRPCPGVGKFANRGTIDRSKFTGRCSGCDTRQPVWPDGRVKPHEPVVTAVDRLAGSEA